MSDGRVTVYTNMYIVSNTHSLNYNGSKNITYLTVTFLHYESRSNFFCTINDLIKQIYLHLNKTKFVFFVTKSWKC